METRISTRGNVTSAGWQVTLCDPMWHVSTRSGVATLLVTYLLTYLRARKGQESQNYLNHGCCRQNENNISIKDDTVAEN